MLTANRIPAAAGALWLVEGFRVVRAAPLQQMMLGLVVLFAVAFTLSLPAGFAVFWLLTPAFVVGPHAVARAAGGRTRPGFALLAQGFSGGFSGEFGALLRLGAIYLAALLAALGATALFDEGRLFRAMTGIERLRVEELFRPELHRALLAWALLETAVLSALWYAPLLVAWHRVPAVKSAFFSAAAIVLNWRAMLAFGAALMLAMLGLSLLALALATLVAKSEAARLSTAAFAATWTFLPILFAASWRSYEAIFGGPPPGGGAGGAGRDTAAEAD